MRLKTNVQDLLPYYRTSASRTPGFYKYLEACRVRYSNKRAGVNKMFYLVAKATEQLLKSWHFPEQLLMYEVEVVKYLSYIFEIHVLMKIIWWKDKIWLLMLTMWNSIALPV